MGTKVLTDFGSAGQVRVSDHDYYALRGHNWRVDSLGYVIRTGDEGSKSRVTLAREVARLAGYGDGDVRYRDGDRMNCTRANLYVKGRRGLARTRRGGPGKNHDGMLQPPGVHRRRQTQAGVNGGLPPGWVLTYHLGPCSFSAGPRKYGCWSAYSSGAVIIGTATRLPLENRIRTRWQFDGPHGSTADVPFYDGCEFLRSAYLESLVPAGNYRDSDLALMRELLGTRRAA
jgi:hypothetical protein